MGQIGIIIDIEEARVLTKKFVSASFVLICELEFFSFVLRVLVACELFYSCALL